MPVSGRQILNKWVLYAVFMWLSCMVLDNGETGIIVTSLVLVLLHVVATFGLLFTCLFLLIPYVSVMCVLCFIGTHLLGCLLGYDGFIKRAINDIIEGHDELEDLNNMCIPVMFVTVFLYYSKQ